MWHSGEQETVTIHSGFSEANQANSLTPGVSPELIHLLQGGCAERSTRALSAHLKFRRDMLVFSSFPKIKKTHLLFFFKPVSKYSLWPSCVRPRL